MFMAILGGTLAGSMYDPVFWLLIAAAVAAAFTNRWRINVAIAAIAAAVVRSGFAVTSTIKSGLTVEWSTFLGGLVVLVVALAVGFAIGSLRQAANTPHQPN